MDVILLFMKLEDKYWGVFLATLFFLYVYALYQRKQKTPKKWAMFLACYGLIAYLLFLCPLTYQLVQRFAPSLSGYYELSHVQLMVPVMVMGGVAALFLAKEQGREKVVFLLIGFAALLLVTGDFAYVDPEPSGWEATCDKEEKKAFDLILAHAKETDTDGKVRIWGMEKLMAKSRLYDASFSPLYGKDIAKQPEKYSEALQMMYRGYSSYEIGTGTAINIGDQLDAIACLPDLYPEADCEYLILYNPKLQYEDYEEFFGKDGFDAVSRVCELGYEKVGKTKHLLLFYKQKG